MLGGTWLESVLNIFFFSLLHDALILADNQLSGSIPSELGLMKAAERLWLCKCGRRVDLCLEQHGLNPSSTSDFAFFPLLHDALILADNQLTGSIPSELGLMTRLWEIYLCEFCVLFQWKKCNVIG